MVTKITHLDLAASGHEVPPIVKLRIKDNEQQTIFEFELPLNCKFEAKLADRFCAIKAYAG